MFTAFDPLLIAAAFLIMLTGFGRRWSSWRRGREELCSGDLAGLLRYLLGHRRILRNRTNGAAHLMLFWGVAIPLLIVILAQFGFAMPHLLAGLLSLLLDLLGSAMLAGTLFFLVRRTRSTASGLPERTNFPLVVLLMILVTGFLASGARISIIHPGFSWSSPVGWLVSLVLPRSPLFMQFMIRIHFFLVLFFIAILPFTFMRHVAAGPLNVYYRKTGPRGEMKPASLEKGDIGAHSVSDFTWKQLLDAEACVSCGRCDESCPASISGKPLSPRKVMRDILIQMEDVSRRGTNPAQGPFPLLEDAITSDEIWACTTCMACVEQCPVFIEPMDKILDMRRYQVLGKGLLPTEARSMIRNLEIFGDVNGKGLAHREDWAINLGVPHISDNGLNAEILLWVGCSGAFHPRYQEATRAMVKILKAAEVRFGILGKEEHCCGDAARRLGNEPLFLDLAMKNMALFNKYQIKKIVTLCPHGYNTLKNEYPALGDRLPSGSETDFEVFHAVEFVLELIEQKRISLKYPVDKKMAIHDPCYLGRVNHIYEPLRAVSRSVPGVELMELERNRENAFCCGGGGGRMWLHESMGENINTLRAWEIRQSGVQLVGAACPFCLTMLEDGISGLEMETPPKVMDITEIVAASLRQVY
ncbi:MAG: 4Fe-4S dicluster domain-containing protein [Deltaproteobacteria bacterium]|nr:4Fe-4S dicluster domain-containing protein [Deltaproteobacteria bacterium]